MNDYVIVDRVYQLIDHLLEKYSIFQEGFLHSYYNPNRGIDDSKRDYFYIRQNLRGTQSTYEFYRDADTDQLGIRAQFYLVASLDSVDMRKAIEILVTDIESCYVDVSINSVDDDPYYIFLDELGAPLTNYLPLIRIGMIIQQPFRECKEDICKVIC